MCACWPRDLLPTGRPTASSLLLSISRFALVLRKATAVVSTYRVSGTSALRLGRRPFASVYHLWGMACPLFSDDRRPGGLGCNRDGVPCL